MGLLIKLGFTLSLLLISSTVNVNGRAHRSIMDADEMREIRRAPSQSQQGQSNFPAFPEDDDQENSLEGQEQDRNRYELEQQQQNKPTPRPNTNSNSNYASRGTTRGYYGNQQNQNGKEFDEKQFVEYVTQRVEDNSSKVDEQSTTKKTDEYVPWYKKVGRFFKNTYHGAVKKIRGERSYYAK